MSVLHPLRQAYNDAISKRYHRYMGGDTSPKRTIQAAELIKALGLTYDLFMTAAVDLWDSYAKKQGWEYPYYNLVLSDKTIERIRKLLDCNGIDSDAPDDYSTDFEYELSYAADYINWMLGCGDKPKREHDVPREIRNQVAEYLSRLHGVPFISSNYNNIALTIGKMNHG